MQKSIKAIAAATQQLSKSLIPCTQQKHYFEGVGTSKSPRAENRPQREPSPSRLRVMSLRPTTAFFLEYKNSTPVLSPLEVRPILPSATYSRADPASDYPSPPAPKYPKWEGYFKSSIMSGRLGVPALGLSPSYGRTIISSLSGLHLLFQSSNHFLHKPSKDGDFIGAVWFNTLLEKGVLEPDSSSAGPGFFSRIFRRSPEGSVLSSSSRF